MDSYNKAIVKTEFNVKKGTFLFENGNGVTNDIKARKVHLTVN